MKIFKNFKEASRIKPGFVVGAIHGGALLGLQGADFIAFYDWASGSVSPAAVFGSFSVPRTSRHVGVGWSSSDSPTSARNSAHSMISSSSSMAPNFSGKIQ